VTVGLLRQAIEMVLEYAEKRLDLGRAETFRLGRAVVLPDKGLLKLEGTLKIKSKIKITEISTRGCFEVPAYEDAKVKACISISPSMDVVGLRMLEVETDG